MTKRPFKSAEIEILSFSKKGYGSGKSMDEFQRIVEVPFTMPGDKARVFLKQKRGGVYVSQLETILEHSQKRILPRCVHFGLCGGCKWQHLSYVDQLKNKEEHVRSLFRPLMEEKTSFFPIVPCDPPWQYRNKMEFSFSSDASGNSFLGLIINESRGKVLNLKECHLVNPWFIEALQATKSWWHESGLLAYHPHSNRGSLRTLTLREGIRTGDRLVMLTVSGVPEFALNRQQLNSFTAFIRDSIEPLQADSQLSIFLRIQQAVKGKETQFYEMLLLGSGHIREILHVQTRPDKEASKLSFTVSPTAFFQPNTRQAEKLYGLALKMLDIPKDSVVYDLYCGTGTLGICAAEYAKAVIGIEISPEAALDARANAANNKLTNVVILAGSVKDIVDNIRKNKQHPLPDIVMVDPPRNGLDAGTVQHLIELKPKKILYISCNPTTQLENVKELQRNGYYLLAIQPVDQFPHTVHIENIIILERKEAHEIP